MYSEKIAQYLNLTDASHRLLKGKINYLTFDSQRPVIHKGQAVSGAYMVIKGKLRVYTYSPHGSEATLYFLNAGETCVLTLNCLFQNVRYPAWVEAFPDTEVAMIPGAIYKQMFSYEQAIQNTTVTALSSLVFTLMDTLEEVQTCNLEQRLARFILGHANQAGWLEMTQQTLAGHLGTTREVIARLLKPLKENKVVSTRRGGIYIHNTKALASIVTPTDTEWP